MSSEMMPCSHEACECFVSASIEPGIDEPGEAFCSAYCRSASSEEEEAACACGHPPCDA